MTNNWSDYYQATAGRAPSAFLLQALGLFVPSPAHERQAIDLGCGAGVETLELLRQGWRVLAIDKEPEALARVRAASSTWQARLATQCAAFEDLTLPRADLIHAGYSLPFCHPAHFDQLWSRLVTALHPGGRFVGHLFGERDGWASRPTMTFHTRAQAEALFQGFDVEHWREEDEDGQTAMQGPKHWHVFWVIARQKGLGIVGQPAPHYYFHRPMHLLFKAAFDAGFVLDGLDEPAQPKREGHGIFSWANFLEIPPFLAARLR
jgi:SAM-dependent methyltransferase